MRSTGREGRSSGSEKDRDGRGDRSNRGGRKGKLFVVGLGPGAREDMSPRAMAAIAGADTVIGYQTYLALVSDLVEGKEVISYPMKAEMERAGRALDEALAGKRVALVSSGDPGIYGMAGPVLEEMSRRQESPDVEIVPGITALNACAAVLGAPLMCDFAAISLSDLLMPGETIRKRLEAAAAGDFVVVLYNPKSQGRTDPIEWASDILLRHRPGSTPVGIVRSARREREEAVVTDLDSMLQHHIDMLTTIIIGNSATFVSGTGMVTHRGYQHSRAAGGDRL